jgi:hypothetical protein
MIPPSRIVAVVGLASALVLVSWGAAPASETPTGPEVLSRTLAYHDPDGDWMAQRVTLRIETGYADGKTRIRLATVDYATADYHDRVERDGHVLEQKIRGNDCELLVDGSTEVDDVTLAGLGLSCERARQLRDYVSYLWGLPMKLRDPGTRVAETV